jgi:hypothetical protein
MLPGDPNERAAADVETKVCRGCGQRFAPHPAVKSQQYCGQAACQRVRRRRWQQQRYAKDRDYRENQRAARRQWARAHPEYWKAYRQTHPEAVERNRRRQRERNQRWRRARAIDKMDELRRPGERAKRRYRLVPVEGGGIAKMDELILEIGMPSQFPPQAAASG